MQILVTNDDGVHAHGLNALVMALARWAEVPKEDGSGPRANLTVIAPLANNSGASAAVGAVVERESIPYRRIFLPGAPEVPAYGIDGSPALATIVGSLGAFGDRPEIVVSGINLGVNVGRSILHSGTVGATLTGSQLGLSGLAVSIQAEADPHWTTAARLAVALLPHVIAARLPTVFNLNVPSVSLQELRGIRPAHIGGAAVIKAADDPLASDDDHVPVATAIPTQRGVTLTDEHEGHLMLRLGSAVPELGDVSDEQPTDDAALVAQKWASLTPLLSVREDLREETVQVVARALSELPEELLAID